MITKFKLEAEGETQEEVSDQMSDLAVQIIGKISPGDGLNWECTAEVVTGSRQEGYKGRMNFVYRDDEDE